MYSLQKVDRICKPLALVRTAMSQQLQLACYSDHPSIVHYVESAEAHHEKMLAAYLLTIF
jgi:hypothetical protein